MEALVVLSNQWGELSLGELVSSLASLLDGGGGELGSFKDCGIEVVVEHVRRGELTKGDIELGLVVFIMDNGVPVNYAAVEMPGLVLDGVSYWLYRCRLCSSCGDGSEGPGRQQICHACSPSCQCLLRCR